MDGQARRQSPLLGIAEQIPLVVTIDTHTREVLAHGGDEALRIAMADFRGTYTPLRETYISAEIHARCERHDGFNRFA